MTESLYIPAADRNEMIRTFAGLVTAKVAKDPEAVQLQLKATVRDHVEASHGNPELFAARMAKQVEAGAIVAAQLLKMLAPRVGLTDVQVQQVLSEVWSSNDFVTD